MKVNLLLGAVVLLLSVALVVQAYVGRDRRHQIQDAQAQICQSQDTGLQVLHDVLVLAMQPQGRKLTEDQKQRIAVFEGEAFARIDAARC